MYTEFTKKKVFELLTVGAGSPAHRCHGRQKVSIPKCDLTGRRVMVDCSSSSFVWGLRGICFDQIYDEAVLNTGVPTGLHFDLPLLKTELSVIYTVQDF